MGVFFDKLTGFSGFPPPQPSPGVPGEGEIRYAGIVTHPRRRPNVVALRKPLKMSQSVFAAALNVSTKLVQSWEQGLRKPDRGELRLIEMLEKQPELIQLMLGVQKNGIHKIDAVNRSYAG